MEDTPSFGPGAGVSLTNKRLHVRSSPVCRSEFLFSISTLAFSFAYLVLNT